tara:strand:- start:300 stop:671 length:372 start_codon:yes stop_codon:yes gene_type:complete
MASADIQARIKKGLARAIKKTGSSSSEKVYIVKESGGNNDPLNPVTPTSQTVELINAIFTEYDTNSIDGNIQAGDRKLVSNSDVAVVIGETITQGTTKYIVIDVDTKAPTSDVLAYISQVRVQ